MKSVIIMLIIVFMNFWVVEIGVAENIKTHLNGFITEQIDLELPLLIIKGSKGFLACGYINVATCNKIQEACAIVSGVKTHDDMLAARINAVSDKAKDIGVQLGMKGSDALELMR